MTERPLTDEELLDLMAKVERRQALAGAAELDEEEAPARERAGEPCPHCSEPALDLGACRVCEDEGCLPRDDWMPGDADCCLTRCIRCGYYMHVDCASESASGNLACGVCQPQSWREVEGVDGGA